MLWVVEEFVVGGWKDCLGTRYPDEAAALAKMHELQEQRPGAKFRVRPDPKY